MGEEEARRRRSGGQYCRHDLPFYLKGPGLQVKASRGGGGVFEKWRSKGLTQKEEPTGFYKDASDVEVSERGATGRGARRQKPACGVGLQGPTKRLRAARQQVQDERWRPAGMVSFLSRRSKTGMRVESRVRRAVQISLRVADGRGVQDAEGEGGGSIKLLNGGMGF